jgi:hypothetical protein
MDRNTVFSQYAPEKKWVSRLDYTESDQNAILFAPFTNVNGAGQEGEDPTSGTITHVRTRTGTNLLPGGEFPR